jgi:hypothetical protein
MAYSSYPPHFLLFPIADGHSNGSEIEAGASKSKCTFTELFQIQYY